MSEFIDPFAGAPADEAQATPEPEAPAETVFDTPPAEAPPTPAPAKKAPAKKAAAKPAVAAPIVLAEDGRWTATLKGGTGFDAPWLVGRFATLEEALEEFSGENAALLAQLMERVQIAGQHFVKLGGGSAPAQRPQRESAPAAAQQPPAGSPPCPGEGWVYKSGTTKSGPKAGQTWQAWMPPQHLKDSGTKPVWF